MASSSLRSSFPLLAGLLVVAVAACGGSSDRRGGTDAGGLDAAAHDAGSRDADVADAGSADAGPVDVDGGAPDAGMPDAGPPTCSPACDPFEYCGEGAVCRGYPACRGDGTCDGASEVCQNRRCVPGDVDIDGDGVDAAHDCDETDPERYPGQTETCNGVDDDCDDMVDEGDPAALCAGVGGTCVDGSCG